MSSQSGLGFAKVLAAAASAHKAGLDPALRSGQFQARTRRSAVPRAYILQYSHAGSIGAYRDGRVAVQNDPERKFRNMSAGD